MNEENVSISSAKGGQAHVVSPREIILKYLPFLPWVIASVIFV